MPENLDILSFMILKTSLLLSRCFIARCRVMLFSIKVQFIHHASEMNSSRSGTKNFSRTPNKLYFMWVKSLVKKFGQFCLEALTTTDGVCKKAFAHLIANKGPFRLMTTVRVEFFSSTVAKKSKFYAQSFYTKNVCPCVIKALNFIMCLRAHLHMAKNLSTKSRRSVNEVTAKDFSSQAKFSEKLRRDFVD